MKFDRPRHWAGRVPLYRTMASTLTAAALILSPLVGHGADTTYAGMVSALSSNATVFAGGLNSPRGLAFGPDGSLYVAESGTGGTRSTVGQCGQVPAPVGPYAGGMDARISRIATDGTRSTVVDKLPSGVTTAQTGSQAFGVAALAFMGRTLYALTTGGGCSHGGAGTSNQVIRVGANGSWATVANLSAFLQVNPAVNPSLDDYEPDGTWYSMVVARGALYATEPNHQVIDRISAKGAISRLVDLSAIYPGNTNWQGPTGMAFANGALYVGYLTTFPEVVGASHIDRIDFTGKRTMVAAGLTAVVGVALHGGSLYVLEITSVGGLPGPGWAGKGAVVRVKADGTPETVVSGLTLPTGMAFGPDGNLYISNMGVGPAGGGQIVRATIS